MGAAVGAGVVVAGSLARPTPAFASATVGVYNVKESPYSAAGNGTTDDTSAIQRAITAAAAAGGGIVFFPAGTYKITGGGLSVGSNVALEGASRTGSTLRYQSPVSSGKLINASFSTGVTVRELGLDGGSESNARYAIYSSENGAGKFLRIERCRIKNFRASNSQAIYTWRSQAVWVQDNELIDNVIPIFIDEPKGDCLVIGNKLWSPAAVTVNGISVSSGSGGYRPLAIIGNTVEDARVDPSNNGVDGQGIRLYNSEGVRVEGNLCRNCATSGILVGANCFGTNVTGNTCVENKSSNHGTGIYVETHGSDTTVGTAGALRGASITGNLCAGNRHGIAVSYAASTVVAGNVVHSNDGEGIFCDSDRCTIANNVSYNNWRTLQPTGGQPPRAGIRNYGKRCVHSGNICYDNSTTKKQSYGIAVSNGDHIVIGNQLAGNLTGGLYQDAGTTNIVANNKTT